MTTPALQLYPYQQEYLRLGQTTRVLLVEKARQIGFSFGSSVEPVLECASKLDKWFVLSKSERQSRDYMLDVAKHVEALRYAAEMWESPVKPQEPQVLEARFPNGSRIVGLPANANTARGISGNLILDEFAFHDEADLIWRGAMPAITRGFKLRVISTPNGKKNRFYRMVRGDLRETLGKNAHLFSIDIHEAARQGLKNVNGEPVNVAELRAIVGDEETWRQEYELIYLDEAITSVLSQELIFAAENEGATTDFTLDWKPSGGLYVGVDIGRKKDLTVIWLDERIGDVSWTRKVLELDRTKFAVQRAELYSILRMPGVKGCCIDATGIGAQLAEEAADEFGFVEQVTFTEDSKKDMAMRMKRRFEDRLVRIPASRLIRDDLDAVKKVTTPLGGVRYLTQNTSDGHADRFWAKALAERAANEGGGTPSVRAINTAGSDRQELRRMTGWA